MFSTCCSLVRKLASCIAPFLLFSSLALCQAKFSVIHVFGSVPTRRSLPASLCRTNRAISTAQRFSAEARALVPVSNADRVRTPTILSPID